jgi:hypothetical protein
LSGAIGYLKLMTSSCISRGLVGLGLCLLLLGLYGCATTPKIDWTSRVGTYTYDEAVLELGPPDKSAELSDGSLVAEWYTRRAGPSLSFGVGTGYYGSSTAVSVGQSVGTTPHGRVLRLTFGPDGILRSWAGNSP